MWWSGCNRRAHASRTCCDVSSRCHRRKNCSFLLVPSPESRVPSLRGNMTRETGTGKYEQALTKCRHLDPVPTAVAHPCDETSLAGVVEAQANRLIAPILVGPTARIRDVAARHGIDLGTTRIVDAAHSHASAPKAVGL